MCKVNGFNLSYESLTSSETRQILRNLPETDPEFFAELTQPRSRVAAPTLTPEEATEEDSEVSEVNSPGDDTAVPLDAVIDAIHGNLDVDDWFVPSEDGGLESTAEAEETLVEEVEGVKIDTTHLVEKLEGRGHRTKTKSKFYSDESLKWWAKGKKGEQ
jgi:hypothetical protein